MLHTLHIRDLALIERAEVRLCDGLNVVSGETGCGKSLLIAALELLRGEKAASGLVRHGAAELQVDGEFRLGDGPRSASVTALVRDLCGAALDDGLLLVTRVVDAHGKSRVRIGGRPATLAALRELGAHLLEIHGQGESRALMRPEIQAETLDAFAGTAPLRREFAASLAAARALRDRLHERSANERERRQRLEFLRFQQRELTELRLLPGEVAALEAEHQVLANLDAVRQHLAASLDFLQDGETNAADLLGRATARLRDAAAFDVRLEAAAGEAEQLEELLASVCRDAQSGLARLDLDPGRLQEVQDRLDAIHAALQRYGPTEQDVFASLAAADAELAAAEFADADPEALAASLRAATEAAAALGRKLLRARRKASAPFAARIVAELQDLGMARTEVRVAMADDFAADVLLDEPAKGGASPHGPVPVDVEVRVNPGEPFRPMRATASGGELARIVLAVKKTLADQDRVPLLVLDELDAEIGGRLGLQVGRKLHEVAAHHQVVVVTHLAPVAAFAERHFLVGKEVRKAGGGERTRSVVTVLAPADVERELAAMATGEAADATALQQARALVARARAAEG